MRSTAAGPFLNARAIAGTHVVTLAWDVAAGKEGGLTGLLGFAVERSEFNGEELVERYWLRGIKRFKGKDEGLAPGTQVPTSEHPIQSFQWGDYTAKPHTAYRYRIVPAYGKPKLLSLKDSLGTEVSVTTESESDTASGTGVVRHDVYFNRGVAGSQAYARKFGKDRPDEAQPGSEQMAWLSRGLYEALTGFIALASGPDGGDYALRALLYEFRYAPVGEAFKAAAEMKADVQIRYEAQTYRAKNESMIGAVEIGEICKPQKVRSGIRHNKFIVLIHKNIPIAVWTGSTNISAGGIFGHSNVGHIVWDTKIAERYLNYWESLNDPKVTTTNLRKSDLEVEPTPNRHTSPPSDRILTLFSARDSEQTLSTLNWYADLVGSAKRMMCMTFAFNFDKIFQDVLDKPSDALRYVLLDKALDPGVEADIHNNGGTVVAAGEKLEKGDLENFLGEKLTGFNSVRYIHDKFILVDPLGNDPIVVTGTANFSRPSQVDNDENMLVIRGNLRVADIYFGEFMRLFDHLYVRYVISKHRDSKKNDPDAGFLRDSSEKWLTPHMTPGPKEKRRRYFMSE